MGMHLGSALCVASGAGNTGAICAVLEYWADANFVGGVMPYHAKEAALNCAVACGQAGAVNVLVDAGAAVGVKGHRGQTFLHRAAELSSGRVILALLQGGADVTDTIDGIGSTPLHLACQYCNVGVEEAVDLLLRWGASETAADANGQTPGELLGQFRGHDDDGCSADELERSRVLLARAPVDRAWRRRCWLVILRARGVAEHSSDTTSSSRATEYGSRRVLGKDGSGRSIQRGPVEDACGGMKARNRGQGAAGIGGIGVEGKEGGLSGLVAVLIALESDEVFRAIVGYL